MAAVTVVRLKRNTAGGLRQQFVQMTGSTGDTFDTGMLNVYKVHPESTITSYSLSTVNGQQRVTFTASGAFTAANVLIWGN